MGLDFSAAVDYMERYSIVLAALVALSIALYFTLRLLEFYIKRQPEEPSMSGNPNPLPPPRFPRPSRPPRVALGALGGFTPEEIVGLAASWKHTSACDGSVSPRAGPRKSGGEWATHCVVCLGEYQDGELLRKLLQCGHIFHQECVDAWLLTHRSCPLCRSTLSVYESNSKEEHPHATPPAPDGVSISIPEGASTSVPQGVTISVPAATDPEVPEEEHSPEASPGLRHCQGSSAATGAGEGEGEAPTDGMNSVAGMRAVDTVPLQELPASESSTRTEDVVVEVSAVSSDSPTDASSHAVNVGHAVGTGRERENTTSV